MAVETTPLRPGGTGAHHPRIHCSFQSQLSPPILSRDCKERLLQASELKPQRELYPARLASRHNFSKKRAEIGKLDRDSQIRMVKGVEKLAAKSKRTAFAHGELALERQIESGNSPAGYDVAAGVAEREGRRRAEGGGVEPVGRWTLARWQRKTLDCHDIRRVDGSCIR